MLKLKAKTQFNQMVVTSQKLSVTSYYTKNMK